MRPSFVLAIVLAFILPASPARAASTLDELTAQPFATPREASQKIRALGLELRRQRDRRALFPLIYALTVEATERKLQAGAFHNEAWVRALVVNYANLYRATIHRELRGARSGLPRGWQLEFGYIAAAAPRGKWKADLDVVYGIHVHIARDLVEALLVTPTRFTTPSRHRDFLLITEALREAMPEIWATYIAYQRENGFLPELQQSVMLKWIGDLRKAAWENARDFSAHSRPEQASLLRRLDARMTSRAYRHGLLLPLMPVSQ